MEPTSATFVTLIIVDSGIKSPPATSLTSRPYSGFRVRCFWHVLLACWLSIYLVHQMETLPV